MCDEDCGICGLPLTDKYSFKMSCNHTFHYECLIKTFSKNKIHNQSKNNCPYCRSHVQYLPVVNGLKKAVYGVHTGQYSELSYLNKCIKNKTTKCKHILTRGKNKGNECGKNCLLGENYCKTHLKKIQKNTNLIVTKVN
jgi:hypothetical protein